MGLRFGTEASVAEQAKLHGLHPRTVYSRIAAGMPIEQALAKPLNHEQRFRIARREAMAKGENKYEGSLCKRGHTVRYVNDNGCVVCQSAQARADRARMDE